MPHITIFHTSDMHNKLTPEWADKLHELISQHPGSFMFDSGDAIWSGNIYWRPGGEPILDLMNSVPYDALCMGNREFHFVGMGLNSKTSRANFPILSANLRATRSPLLTKEGPGGGYPFSPPCEGGVGEGCFSPSPGGEGRGEGASLHFPTDAPESRIVPFIKFTRDDFRITVLGLTVPCVTERMLVKKVSDFYFEQPITAAEQIVPRLRSECDLLIALTHIGIKADHELADRVPGIDLILGGHTHVITEEPERVGDTFIIHHGFYVHYVGKVDIDVDSGGVRVKNELIPLAKA